MRGIRSVVPVVVVALALAACGATSHDTNKKATSANASTSKITGSKLPKFIGVQHPIPHGKALANDPNMYKYVLKTGCTSIPGGWKATGTAQNMTDKALGFKVLVFFTDAQARIVDSATGNVTVPARTKGTWTASRQFKAPKGTLCVVRAVTKR